MRDISSIVDEIKSIWLFNKKNDLLVELDFQISGGATGGEIFSRVKTFFKQLKDTNDIGYLSF